MLSKKLRVFPSSGALLFYHVDSEFVADALSCLSEATDTWDFKLICTWTNSLPVNSSSFETAETVWGRRI